MAAATRRYASPLKMVSSKGYSDVPSLKRRLEELSSRSTLSSKLLLFRNKLGLTEEELAEKMEISVEDVQEIEDKFDDEILFAEFAHYFFSMGYEITLRIQRKDQKIVDEVRYHVSSIEGLLNHLVNICQGDVEMEKSARKFLKRFNSNFVKMIESMTSELKSEPIPRDESSDMPMIRWGIASVQEEKAVSSS